MGRIFQRGGRSFRYVYKGGKKTARFLIEVYELRPSDIRRGTKRFRRLRALYHADGMEKEFDKMVSDILS